jgi:hypothetical protein
MAQEKNRVLARKGARCVTPAELDQVGAFGTNFIIITHQATNMGKDSTVDEITG